MGHPTPIYAYLHTLYMHICLHTRTRTHTHRRNHTQSHSHNEHTHHQHARVCGVDGGVLARQRFECAAAPLLEKPRAIQHHL